MTPEHGTDGTMTNGAATNTVRAQTRLGMLDIDPSKERFFPEALWALRNTTVSRF